MIVVMAPQATAAEIEVVQARIAEEGYAAHLSQGEARTVIGVIGAGDDRKQTLECARAVRRAGAQVLRGGAFKPRTSPYDFQGLGESGLDMLAAARDETGLPVVTEARAVRDVETVAEKADIIQIGARNWCHLSSCTSKENLVRKI